MLALLFSEIGCEFKGFYTGKMLKNNVDSKVIVEFGDGNIEIRHAYQSIYMGNGETDFGVYSVRKNFSNELEFEKQLKTLQYSNVEEKIKDIKMIRVCVHVTEENESKLSLHYDAGVVFELEDRTIVFEKGSWLGEDILIHFTPDYQKNLIALEDEWSFEATLNVTFSRDIVSVEELVKSF
jgi:hypothetical protein